MLLKWNTLFINIGGTSALRLNLKTTKLSWLHL